MPREGKPSILVGCNLFRMSLTSSENFQVNAGKSVRIYVDLKTYVKGTKKLMGESERGEGKG
jgi:hypothetical protein